MSLISVGVSLRMHLLFTFILSGPTLVNALSMFSRVPGLEQALLVLDTDKSGRVEKAEVEAFAKSQGLSDEDVREEFKDIDLNGNGELDADEIRNTLSQTHSSEDVASASVATDAPPLAIAPAPLVVRDPALTTAVVAASTPVVAPRAVELTKAVEQPKVAEQSQPQAVEQPQPKVSVIHLHIDELNLEAEQHAGKALAEVFSRTAAKALEARKLDSQKAEQLEEQAKAIRGQSSEIKRKAAAETIKAATDAASEVLLKTHEQVKALEEEAAQAEKEAAERRIKAKEAMQKALTAQADMAASVQELKGHEKE